MVSLDEAGVASYTFHFHDTANFGWQVDDLPTLVDSDWLHIASLSCVVPPGAEVLLDWMRGVTCGVSYDPNVRPTVISDPGDLLDQGAALVAGGRAAWRHPQGQRCRHRVPGPGVPGERRR